MFDKKYLEFSYSVRKGNNITSKKWQKIVTLHDFKGQIYDFLREGPNPTVEGLAKLLFCQIFAKTAWKWKNWTGRGVHAKVEQIACVNAST